LKKIDKLVSGSFVGPYLLSFFVAEFVLIMMFLWKYIDEILGKGFTMFDILELLFYYGVTIIPMAVPITILISSVMVYGDMSEKHELASLKSAGVSLFRIMRPAMYIALGTAIFSIFASNYLKPRANYMFLKRFTALRKQKPAMTIEEGIFNKDFKGFAIRVASKGDDDQTINDVIIYDHTDNDKTKISLIKSQSGKMYTSEDGGYFVMNLKDGYQYRELASSYGKGSANKSKYPFMRTKFDTWSKVFDMSEFEFDANSINVNPNKEDMLTTPQLLSAIDSVKIKSQDVQLKMLSNFDGVLDIYSVDEYQQLQERLKEEKSSAEFDEDNEARLNRDSSKRSQDRVLEMKNRFNKEKRNKTQGRNSKIKSRAKINYLADVGTVDNVISLLDMVVPSKKKEIVKQAASLATSRKDHVNGYVAQINQLRKKQKKYQLRLHQSYSWALICIIFLFIGAPLGSIIRKGGYGYPLLVAILFYMVFMIITIMGQKLNRNETLSPEIAAWMPCVVLAPIAAWLTIKAMRDSKFIGLNAIVNWVEKLFARSEA
jgi:lipopolysaccharide export system permease protein